MNFERINKKNFKKEYDISSNISLSNSSMIYLKYSKYLVVSNVYISDKEYKPGNSEKILNINQKYIFNNFHWGDWVFGSYNYKFIGTKMYIYDRVTEEIKKIDKYDEFLTNVIDARLFIKDNVFLLYDSRFKKIIYLDNEYNDVYDILNFNNKNDKNLSLIDFFSYDKINYFLILNWYIKNAKKQYLLANLLINDEIIYKINMLNNISDLFFRNDIIFSFGAPFIKISKNKYVSLGYSKISSILNKYHVKLIYILYYIIKNKKKQFNIKSLKNLFRESFTSEIILKYLYEPTNIEKTILYLIYNHLPISAKYLKNKL